jgi:hypothetical protein
VDSIFVIKEELAGWKQQPILLRNHGNKADWTAASEGTDGSDFSLGEFRLTVVAGAKCWPLNSACSELLFRALLLGGGFHGSMYRGSHGALPGIDARLRSLHLHWVVLAQPFFDLLALRSNHHTLPFYGARALTVLSHDVRSFIEDVDEAVCLSPLEVVRREGSVIFFLHLNLL